MADFTDTIRITSQSDLTVHLTYADTETNGNVKVKKDFIVSSAAMRLASPVWHAMLDPKGHFMESQSSATNGGVDFEDDDGTSLEILLNIAHMNYHLLQTA